MNILVLNGSPKGNQSVTLQTALYLEKCFKEHKFTYLKVSQQIKKITRDFSDAKKLIEAADLIMFVYPIYTFLAPYQLQRFIELMKENNTNLKGKFVSQITTSKHFYDMTAHKFIEENSFDMDATYVCGLSADMEDLLLEEGRDQAKAFFKNLMFRIENEIYQTKKSSLASTKKDVYVNTLPNKQKTGKKDVVLVTNVAEDDDNLKNMMADFVAECSHNIRIVNLREYPFSGGCLGCFACAVTEKCVYRDGFDEFLRTKIQNADAMVYAFTIENHYTHSSFKCYDDRQFCNGHRFLTKGMPLAYIISGNYSRENNLQTLVEARSEVGETYLCGVATDEEDTQTAIIKTVKSLEYALENKMCMPQNFYGVGGTKIFRDLVFEMRGLMKADHKFYKKNGVYDFPHKKRGRIIQMQILGSIMSIPSVKAKMKGQMSKYILMPYKKVIEQED